VLVHLPERAHHEVALRRGFGPELALARGRPEVPLPVRRPVIAPADVEARETVPAQVVQRDPLAGGRGPVDEVLEAFRVRPPEPLLREAHARGETPEDLAVGD